ncbi:leucine-rich repeat-containing protein 74A-like [Mytilus edulis]|uniref:leucine-rich repeat-containing protein 74A-like n=1 Tax=Mytilus edulis TaxID=6550 RepID=UPI0039F10740
MPVGTDGPTVQPPRLSSPSKLPAQFELNEEDELMNIKPEDSVSETKSRRSSKDTSGLITDLTRLKAITGDDRIGDPLYVTEYRQKLPDLTQEIIKERTFEGDEFEIRGLSGADLTRHLQDEYIEDDAADGRSDVFEDNESNISSLESDDEKANEEYDTDFDPTEADRLIYPERYETDPNGVGLYERHCEEIGVQPITYFIKHMQDTNLIMKFHGLGPQGMRAIAGNIEINTVTERIDLEGNYILGEGATYLTRVLKDNSYVSELVLSENKIGSEGAVALCELLTKNKTIIHLNLTGNEIDDSAADAFYDMLVANSEIKTLILKHNCFEEYGADSFCKIMDENVTLQTLDLSWNHFQSKGCAALAEGIKLNEGLKYLDVSMNGFGLEGARAMEDALKTNRILRELHCTHCRIPVEGAPHIAAGIQVNEALVKLYIGHNEYGCDGGFFILEGVNRNDKKTLKYLDFANLMVRRSFKALEKELKEDRSLVTVYGGVLVDVASFASKIPRNPEKLLASDPMTKLREYVEKSGYRMIDLLKTFDRDNDWQISREELSMGVKKCEIDLTEDQIDKLMSQLDLNGDGQIDLSELMEGKLENTLLQREAIRYREEVDKKTKKQEQMTAKADPQSFMEMMND